MRFMTGRSGEAVRRSSSEQAGLQRPIRRRRSGEELPGPPVAGVPDARRNRENRRTHVLDVLVEPGVVAGEAPLQRNDPPPDVALVGEEEQPRLQTTQTVGAVGEVVAAAQDADAVV